MKMDKIIIYLIYAFAITWMVVFTVRAAAMTPTARHTRTKACLECLYRYAGCMDFASKSASRAITRQLQYSCIDKLASCEQENSCKVK